MRQPMEEVYGAQVFAKTWEGWVDGIAQFAKRPEGTEYIHKWSNLKLKTIRNRQSRDDEEMFWSPDAMTKEVMCRMVVKY